MEVEAGGAVGNHVDVCVAGGGRGSRKYSGRLPWAGTPADTRKRGDTTSAQGERGGPTREGGDRDTRHDGPAATKINCGEPMGDEAEDDTENRD